MIFKYCMRKLRYELDEAKYPLCHCDTLGNLHRQLQARHPDLTLDDLHELFLKDQRRSIYIEDKSNRANGLVQAKYYKDSAKRIILIPPMW